MKRVAVVLLLLIANAILGSSKTTLPDTAPGKLMQEWLTAFNAADEAALRKFAEERYTEPARGGRSAEEIAEGQMMNRRGNGGWDLVKVEESTPQKIAVLLKSRGTFPNYARFSFELSEGEPARIAKRLANPAGPPDEAPRKSAQEIGREVEGKLAALADKGEFSGAVLIGKDGEPVWQKAFGMADREKKIPAALETRFHIGSMNKMFTAVAIAQLVEAGKLKFDDTLASVLPEYPNVEAAKKITIGHLLTHAAGLGDFFSPEFDRKKDEARELRDYLQFFAEKPPGFEPGTRRAYSNGGFIVLGLVIEKISGQNYYDYVQEHIFGPAGMKSTSSVLREKQTPDIAVGYQRGPDGKLAPNWETLPYRGSSAGGGESTVGDFMRFAEALRNGKLISRQMAEAVTTAKPLPNPGPMADYAYGFMDRREGDRRVVGHGGGAPGMNGDLAILWNEGYVVVALANLDPPAAQDVVQYIVGRLK